MNAFFASQLSEAGVEVIELKRAEWSSGAPLGERIAWRTSGIGQHGVSDVLAMAQFFHNRRPAVVHAWLDEVNIKAGMAAIAAGVQRIVLSGRSVAPWQFPIYRPYLRYGYQLLSMEPTVLMLNNSEAEQPITCIGPAGQRDRFEFAKRARDRCLVASMPIRRVDMAGGDRAQR